MELLAQYRNGNYDVKLYEDGTKELVTEDDSFIASFPDSIDLKITDYCDLNCPMCHEKSSPSGRHAKLDASFISTLRCGTELAIGGGNPLSHPELVPFLRKLKEQGIIPNVTINERHLPRYEALLEQLIEEKLIYGLGISLSTYEENTFNFASNHSNTVFHVICGIANVEKLIEAGRGEYKLLVLGYKRIGRGEAYYSSEIQRNIFSFFKELPRITAKYGIVSFDNLALRQLKVKDRIEPTLWEERFMGDDGQSTMYIDLVKGEFAVSSTSKNRYPIMEKIENMFEVVRTK